MTKIKTIFLCLAILQGNDALFGKKKPKISNEQVEKCPNKPEGLQWFSRGVDIARFDLFHLDSETSDGFRGPVIDFNCDSGKQWTNSFTETRHDIPDEIWSIGNVPGDWMNPHWKVLESSKEAKSYLAELLGVDLVPGMFSYTKSDKVLTDQFLSDENRNVVIDISSPISSTEALLAPTRSLKPALAFEESLKRLPTTYKDSRSEYEKFIDTFGTHFLASASFGPFMRNQITVPRLFFKDHGEDYVVDQSIKLFRNWIRTAISGGEHLDEIDAEFTGNVSVLQKVYGGQAIDFSENRFSTWVKNASGTPIVFSAKLTPIYELVSDDEKRESFKEAIEAYLDQASLNDLEKQLVKLSNYYSKQGTSEKVDELLLGVRYAKAVDPQLVEHDLNSKLADHVDFNVEFPDWWKDIRMCFRFQSENKDPFWQNCVGKTPACAAINQFTDTYEDFSKDSGGCQMSWGVFAITDSADWFENVHLCFNYSATGNELQCNQGSTGEICSPINQYTDYYLDHTDNRRGGCEMSWKLKVSDDGSIPAWFLNSKLCYRAKEDSRVGVSKSVTECAYVNSYTKPRLDNTRYNSYLYSRRDLIQWGIFDM